MVESNSAQALLVAGQKQIVALEDKIRTSKDPENKGIKRGPSTYGNSLDILADGNADRRPFLHSCSRLNVTKRLLLK
jgi:hypothetical protein